MLELIFVANYNPEGCQAGGHPFPELKDKVYTPLLNVLEEFAIPTVHCFSAHTLELFYDHHIEDYLERLKILTNVGRAEIASKGYSDAFLSELPEPDIRQQFLLAQEIENDIWGSAPGFRPAEGWLDPMVTTMLKEIGFNWAVISGSSIFNTYGQDEKLLFSLLRQKGLNGQSLDVICTFDDPKQSFSQSVKDIFRGQCNIKQFVNELFRMGELQKVHRPMVVLEFEMEAPFWSNDPSSSIQQLRFFLQCLERLGSFNYSMPSRILGRAEGEEPMWCYPQPNIRRLELLLDDAREAIHRAEHKDPASGIVKQAWKSLLLAENYTAFQLAALANNSIAEKKEMLLCAINAYLQACEQAWAAKKLACGAKV